MTGVAHRPGAAVRHPMALAVMVLLIGLSRAAGSAERATKEDRAFLAWDIQIEIQQQDMGRLAARRALTQQVRDLGNYLVERHRQTQQRLQKVAHQMGVVLSDRLSATHLRVQKHYAAIPDTSFDQAFVRHEAGDYRYFLTHFEAAAASGSASVRTYAAGEIPHLKEDQAKIAALRR